MNQRIAAVATALGLAILIGGAGPAKTTHKAPAQKAPAPAAKPVPVTPSAPPAAAVQAPAVPSIPLIGWDKIRFGMSGKALTDAYPGALWSEEKTGAAEGMKRTFRTQIEGGDYDIIVLLDNDRVSRVSVAKVLAPGMTEVACKAAFAPDDARLRKAYGTPTRTSVKGNLWVIAAGGHVVLVNALFTPNDGTPTRCLVTAGFYPPGSPLPPGG